jgi:hypothetical protein
MKKHKEDNDKRTEQVEEFIISEAQKTGVIKLSKIRKYKNPNKYEK